MGATNRVGSKNVARDPRSPFGIGPKKKTKQEEQMESLQAELKTLQDQFGKFSQSQQTASTSFTAPRTSYSVAGTLGNRANLRIASNEPRASRVRRANRAM